VRTLCGGGRAGFSAKRDPIFVTGKAAKGVAGRVTSIALLSETHTVVPAPAGFPSEDSASTPLPRTSASIHSSLTTVMEAGTFAQTVALPARISSVMRPGRSELTDCTTPEITTRLYSYSGFFRPAVETGTAGGSVSGPSADTRASTTAGAAPADETTPVISTRQPLAGGFCPGARLIRIPPVAS
jgi:hypothetical protein